MVPGLWERSWSYPRVHVFVAGKIRAAGAVEGKKEELSP
jgi:hypothetical protein